MKKCAFLLSLSLTLTTAFAELPRIDIDQFRGDYRSPAGSGIAQRFDVPGFAHSKALKNISIGIEKTQTGYNMTTPDHFFEWSDAPSLLMNLESAQWSAIGVKSSPQSFVTKAQSLNLNREKDQINFRNFLLDCKLTKPSHPSFSQTFLEACLNGQSRATLTSFQKTDKSATTSKLLQDLMMAVTPYEIAPLSQTTVDDVEIKINRQSFEAQLTTKVVFNTTVKLDGMVYYENDQNRIRLRLDKAKAGFLNVLSKVFEQLEKNQSDKLIVQRPWVTIILADE